ncbi:class I SAM-dependent methyltransferase [Desulfobacter latus]|uniref:Class I SAM-dependent methyltransferase n=1 Tax=Desulfobacter latus TaxID=2292 RepID=A0A850TFJ4_9BACT|nr:class I SAM-dependent methyltransferase [Desulfobacter latus]NWH06226.1 class I SAM-dependent methyltransferase [Desulfobacter latus]
MAYEFDFKAAQDYDAFFAKGRAKHCFDLEIKLISALIRPMSGKRMLDIGCGTGLSLEPFVDLGMNLTGIDPSAYMLDKAAERLGCRVDLHRGSAEDLPFDDNCFDTALMFFSLEFSNRPAKAIEEACRVAREQVVIGVHNRYAPRNMIRRVKGFFFPDMYSHAHLFSVWELKTMITSILGTVPVKWRTTVQFPFLSGRLISKVESIRMIQWSCWGSFIGMRIKPVPKFRTRPLVLKTRNCKINEPATGLALGFRKEE